MTARSLRAITRDLSPAISRCELTHLARAPIDYPRAVAQHEAYVTLLQSRGLAVTRLPPEPDLPDAVFVEDTAIVLDEIAVLTRAGATSRRLESATIAAALQPWRSIVEITAPATLDGGDVLQIGRTLYVGLSSRSNSQGATQLRELLGPFGYRVESVAVSGCLHLKSAATAISETWVLVNPAWCDPKAFAPAQIIAVEPSEPNAANLLRLDDCVVMDQAYPETAARLRTLGVSVHLVDLSELAKAEGAVTCCSLVFAV